MADIQALRAELDADPVSLGYAAAGWTAPKPTEAQYQAVADLINAKGRPKDRTLVPGYEVFAAIKPADFLTVYDPATGNPTHRSYLNVLFVLDAVPLDNQGVRSVLTSIFAGKSQTLSAIGALQTETVSRANEIGWLKVKVGDLIGARG